MSCVMIATFSFKILHNLLPRYTSGPGPSGIAWQHLLEFSWPVLRRTPHVPKINCWFKKFKKIERWDALGETKLQPGNWNSKIKNQNSRSHSSQCRYGKRKIVIFKITGISLEFILIYIFAGLLTILGAVLLAVCINQYRKKGNQSTKRYNLLQKFLFSFISKDPIYTQHTGNFLSYITSWAILSFFPFLFY